MSAPEDKAPLAPRSSVAPLQLGELYDRIFSGSHLETANKLAELVNELRKRTAALEVDLKTTNARLTNSFSVNSRLVESSDRDRSQIASLNKENAALRQQVATLKAERDEVLEIGMKQMLKRI